MAIISQNVYLSNRTCKWCSQSMLILWVSMDGTCIIDVCRLCDFPPPGWIFIG